MEQENKLKLPRSIDSDTLNEIYSPPAEGMLQIHGWKIQKSCKWSTLSKVIQALVYVLYLVALILFGRETLYPFLLNHLGSSWGEIALNLIFIFAILAYPAAMLMRSHCRIQKEEYLIAVVKEEIYSLKGLTSDEKAALFYSVATKICPSHFSYNTPHMVSRPEDYL